MGTDKLPVLDDVIDEALDVEKGRLLDAIDASIEFNALRDEVADKMRSYVSTKNEGDNMLAKVRFCKKALSDYNTGVRNSVESIERSIYTTFLHKVNDPDIKKRVKREEMSKFFLTSLKNHYEDNVAKFTNSNALLMPFIQLLERLRFTPEVISTFLCNYFIDTYEEDYTLEKAEDSDSYIVSPQLTIPKLSDRACDILVKRILSLIEPIGNLSTELDEKLEAR